MHLVTFCVLLVVIGWLLRGALQGRWRKNPRYTRISDARHCWLEVGGEVHAFTDDQLAVAKSRADTLAPRFPHRWRSSLLWILALGGLILLFTGCSNSVPDAKPTAKPGQLGTLGTAMGGVETANTKANDAGAKADALTAQRDGKILADANAAAAANQSNPAGVPKEQVAASLDVLRARLQGAVENAIARAEAAERDKLIEQGKSAEAHAATERAIKEAQSNASEIAVARSAAFTANKQRDDAVAAQKAAGETFARQLEQNKKDNQAIVDAAVADAKSKERAAMLRKLAYALLGLAILSALVAGATLYLTKGVEWERAAIAAGCSASCFALYWTLNQPWFKYLAWGCGVGLIGAVIWYLWREQRQHAVVAQLAQRSTEADEAEDALKKVMSVLDKTADSAVSGIRAELGRVMDNNHKALVNELKAEDQRAAAA